MRIQDNERVEKIMVNGRLQRAQPDNSVVELRRGMLVITCDGREAGLVAAIILEEPGQHISHILLCQLPVISNYRLIPINLIAHVSETAIHLNIHSNVIAELAIHQPG